MTEFWTSAALTSVLRVDETAAEMEQLGWTGMTTVDSQNLATDPYIFLTLAAMATEQLGVMTSVTNAVTRHPAVAASAARTLQAVSGGRFVLGIGRGDSALAHIGRSPAKLRWFDRYLQALTAYCRSEEVGFDDVPIANDVAGSIDDLELADGPTASSIGWGTRIPRVPVVVAATGPKVIASAARHTDGIVFAVGAQTERVQWAIETAHAAAEAAGRDPSELALGAYVTVVCSDDVTRAREISKASTSLFARFSAMHGTVSGPADEVVSAVVKQVHDAYDMNRHSRHDGAQTNVLTDEFIDRFAIVGSVDHCVDRLGQLNELGITKFNVLGAAVNHRDPEVQDCSRRFITDVAPQLR